jgi:hypothetical protein
VEEDTLAIGFDQIVVLGIALGEQYVVAIATGRYVVLLRLAVSRAQKGVLFCLVS